jgi:hypothetical protein
MLPGPEVSSQSEYVATETIAMKMAIVIAMGYNR